MIIIALYRMNCLIHAKLYLITTQLLHPTCIQQLLQCNFFFAFCLEKVRSRQGQKLCSWCRDWSSERPPHDRSSRSRNRDTALCSCRKDTPLTYIFFAHPAHNAFAMFPLIKSKNKFSKQNSNVLYEIWKFKGVHICAEGFAVRTVMLSIIALS